MNKKGIALLLIIIIVGIWFGFSFFQDKKDMIQLEKKVSLVNKLFINGGDVGKVQSEIKKKVVHSKQKKVEKSVNSYLTDLIKIYQDSDKIIHSKDYESMFLMSNIDNNEIIFQNNMGLLDNNCQKLEENKKLLEELSSSKKRNSYAKKDFLKSYKSIVKKINMKYCREYIKIIESSIHDMENEKRFMNYLFNNINSWKTLSDSIEFQNRSSYLGIDNIEKTIHTKKILYHLVEDNEGPNIIAEDVSIYLNQSIDLKSKTQCIDNVDGEVDCMISGSYDNKKIGSYSISIQAKDESNNLSEKNITVKVIKKTSDKPYIIDVIRNQNVVVVYGQDDNGNYSKIVQVFTCSTGKDNATPTGTFYTSKGSVWGSLYGGVWGQYTTRITGDILFHSVPYYSKNKGDLEWEEYNKLGTQASLGCVRLSVRDVKWIFDNCPIGTQVKIYDGYLPSEIEKPNSIHIDGTSPNRGWDPTDDDSSNPWR